MQSDLLLGDQMYHLTHSKVEIPHSENEDVEYYTTYPKTPEKTGGSPVAHAHTQWSPFGVTFGSHGTFTTVLHFALLL